MMTGIIDYVVGCLMNTECTVCTSFGLFFSHKKAKGSDGSVFQSRKGKYRTDEVCF
jgi:hypothetical protein